jgi:hypothetical protein
MPEEINHALDSALPVDLSPVPQVARGESSEAFRVDLQRGLIRVQDSFRSGAYCQFSDPPARYVGVVLHPPIGVCLSSTSVFQQSATRTLANASYHN